MAEETKNKASKRMLEDKEFWGRIGMVLGIIAITNSFNVNVSLYLVFFNLISGIIFFIVGYLIAPRKTPKFWSGMSITVGFSAFFFGIRVRPYMPIADWTIIAVGITLIVLGFCVYFIDKVKSRKTEQKVTES